MVSMNPVCPFHLLGCDSILSALAIFLYLSCSGRYKLVLQNSKQCKGKLMCPDQKVICFTGGRSKGEPESRSSPHCKGEYKYMEEYSSSPCNNTPGSGLGTLTGVVSLPSEQLSGSMLFKVTECRSVWWNRYNMNNIWQDNDALCVARCCRLKLSPHISPWLLGNHNFVLITGPGVAQGLCFTNSLK